MWIKNNMAKEKEEDKKPKGPPSLADALADLQKMGIEIAGYGTDRKIENIEKFPTGLLCLDYILGGGYPKGRIIEMYGWESSGKSTMTLLSIAECQRNGGLCAYIDAEHAYDPAYAVKLGVDVSQMITMQPFGGEEALAAVEKLASTGKVQLIVVDSVAALVPQVEVVNEVGKAVVGRQAAMMSQALRKITSVVSQSKTTVIFINQLRNKVGVVYGSPETTPGGLALKFYASIRFKVSKKAKLKKADETVYGHLIQVAVDKSKVSQAYLTTEFELRFGGLGLNLVADTVDAAVASGIIIKDGSKYLYNGEVMSIGYDKLVEALTENADTYATIRKQVTDKISALKNTPLESIHSGAVAKAAPEEKTKKNEKQK
jgi:recombination protein RecA